MLSQVQKDFGSEGLKSWAAILDKHNLTRRDQIIDIFHEGLKKLDISSKEIPSLEKVNEKLLSLTGFQGIFVDGLEDGGNFFSLIANKKFPIGNFIRDAEDLNYTPAPDVIHDLYGHLPFFTDVRYAKFCEELGKAACSFKDRQDLFQQFENFFWFTIEFGLVKTNQGVRIFGAGIASSIGECKYALSDEPEVLPFDVDVIRKHPFRIDEMQKKLFVLESVEQLYESLPELCAKLESER